MKASRVRKLSWRLLFVYLLIVVLIVLAQPDPAGALFWVGVGLAAVGLWIRVWAAGHLIKNRRLTTTGPYAYVKNPLYVGTFFNMVGFCMMARGGASEHWALANFNWLLLGLGVAGFVLYYVPYKKKREGDRLREIYGEDWDRYDRAVPDYFPRLSAYRHSGAEPVTWTWSGVCANSEQWTVLAVAAGVVALLFNHRIVEFFSRYVG